VPSTWTIDWLPGRHTQELNSLSATVLGLAVKRTNIVHKTASFSFVTHFVRQLFHKWNSTHHNLVRLQQSIRVNCATNHSYSRTRLHCTYDVKSLVIQQTTAAMFEGARCRKKRDASFCTTLPRPTTEVTFRTRAYLKLVAHAYESQLSLGWLRCRVFKDLLDQFIAAAAHEELEGIVESVVVLLDELNLRNQHRRPI